MTSISRHDVNALLRQVQGNSLFNRQLSSVCQVNGLKSTGVKAELQRRIVHRESLSCIASSVRPGSRAWFSPVTGRNAIHIIHTLR